MENPVCDCGNNGSRGDLCEIDGCPGVGSDCTGHGLCNVGTRQCTCDAGWKTAGCNVPECTDDCNDHGFCNGTTGQPQCDCDEGFFGWACEFECKNGTVERYNDTCMCEPCYSGLECDVLCSSRGECINGTCDCGFDGYRGEFCNEPGCPGVDGLDCSGHGACNTATRSCTCNTGYNGTGCEMPVCPEDCNNRGECDSAGSIIPSCINCIKGYMGEACEIECGGIQEPMNSGICVCDNQCKHGLYCEHTCGGIGVCMNETQTCNCTNSDTGINDGFWGDYCDEPGCPGIGGECSDHGSCVNPDTGLCSCDPGFGGDYCEEYDCPGNPDCSDHGICMIMEGDSIPSCQCEGKWMGIRCEVECFNGTIGLRLDENGLNETYCKCDDCFSGPSCNIECGEHGQCSKNETGHGVCECDVAWWGELCTTKGCPGVGESCSGEDRGTCLVTQQTCDCKTGWRGDTCYEPDCPGEVDCSGRGRQILFPASIQ